jgi:hypothetical protein
VIRRATRNDGVFINCPFDAAYLPLFEVLVFTIAACGFVPRCSLEESDGSEVRIDKILRLMRGSRYAIHDISCVELDARQNLPRFNMPFELGLDIGCKKFGGNACAHKRILILDRDRFRCQIFLSDIAGQDIRAHGGDVDTTVTVVRNWLRSASGRRSIPGDEFIRSKFAAFAAALPRMCRRGHLNRNALSYADLLSFVQDWLEGAVRGS